MSRCAVFPLRYVIGKTSLGVKKRNALTRRAIVMVTPTTMSEGWKVAR